MSSKRSLHLPALAFHEKKSLARGQRSQKSQFEFDLSALVRGFEKKNPFRFIRALHKIIISQVRKQIPILKGNQGTKEKMNFHFSKLGMLSAI